jgi:hypothetical protein
LSDAIKQRKAAFINHIFSLAAGPSHILMRDSKLAYRRPNRISHLATVVHHSLARHQHNLSSLRYDDQLKREFRLLKTAALRSVRPRFFLLATSVRNEMSGNSPNHCEAGGASYQLLFVGLKVTVSEGSGVANGGVPRCPPRGKATAKSAARDDSILPAVPPLRSSYASRINHQCGAYQNPYLITFMTPSILQIDIRRVKWPRKFTNTVQTMAGMALSRKEESFLQNRIGTTYT